MASTQRVYHIDELKTNSALKIDVKYYLSQQIHPVIMRLCLPLEDIDAKMIAEHLGFVLFSEFCCSHSFFIFEINISFENRS